jgi:O-antigen ligase
MLLRNPSNKETAREYLRKIELFDIFWGILIFYAFIPEKWGREILWDRWCGIPISYIPFLTLFGFLSSKYLLGFMLKGKGRVPLPKPVRFLLLLLAYFPLQLGILLLLQRVVILKDYIIDYVMLIFYCMLIFYTVTIYFRRKTRPLEKLNEVLNNSLKYLFIICVVSITRFVVYDIHFPYEYFNLFYPLGYRLFEVLFLSFFSALALGWYYTFNRKIYLVYFLFYGVALILAGSRTGYIAYTCILLYLIARMNYRIVVSYLGPVVILTVLIAIWIGGNYVGTRASLMKDIPLFLNLDFQKANTEKRSTRRLGYLVGSLEIFKENPFLGVGIGKTNFASNFPPKYKRSVLVARPHNTYFYFLASTGVFGILLLGMFWVTILKQGYRSYRCIRFRKFLSEKTLHILIGNILILLMQFGYEFETGPFVWVFWAMSFNWFYFVIRQDRASGIETRFQGSEI